MNSPRGRQYTVTDENITLVDAGDFFSLSDAAANAARIIEVRVWQRGTTTLTMDTLRFLRTVGGSPAGGTGLSEREWDVSGAVAGRAALSLPTTDIETGGTLDWEYRVGWNLLQEMVWLPTPELQLHLASTAEFAIQTETGTAHTGVGYSVTWIEYGV